MVVVYATFIGAARNAMDNSVRCAVRKPDLLIGLQGSLSSDGGVDQPSHGGFNGGRSVHTGFLGRPGDERPKGGSIQVNACRGEGDHDPRSWSLRRSEISAQVERWWRIRAFAHAWKGGLGAACKGDIHDPVSASSLSDLAGTFR